jgi:hypothetical protein
MFNKKIVLRCSKCKSTDIKLFLVDFKNSTRHIMGICSCGKYRHLSWDLFTDEEISNFPLVATPMSLGLNSRGRHRYRKSLFLNYQSIQQQNHTPSETC